MQSPIPSKASYWYCSPPSTTATELPTSNLELAQKKSHISVKMVRIDHHEYLSEEEKRLKEDRERTKYWKKWGPYVAERQWATGIFTTNASIGLPRN